MAELRAITVLQICPNDHPPFLDICDVYQRAVAELGQGVLTVFLSPAHGEPLAGAIYLDQPNLRSARQLGRVLRGRVAGSLPKESLPLVLCHRYRALQAFLHSGLGANHTLCIAHEFEFFRRARRRLRRALFQRHVHFAGVSPAVVAELAGSVTTPLLLPNGIDLSRQAEQRLSRTVAQRELGLQDDDFNVAVVGRLHPKKQPQLALAGFSLFANECPNATLTYMGDGELMAALQNAAVGLSVSFSGFVSQAARYLAAFDVVLIPSGEREAFNMVALEAMAAGVLVVAGPAPGPRFVLGDVGVYFSEASPTALARALGEAHTLSKTNRPAAQQVVEQGRQRAQAEFSLAAIGRRLQSWSS